MKRFWKEARPHEVEGGFEVRLDARPVRTPAKAPMILPTRALAEAVAAEWSAQGDEVRPAEMPLTRAANSTIDRVIAARREVAKAIAAFGETDLLCYRAPFPPELADQQAAGWDPMLDWADEALGARLLPGEGVMHVAQDPAAVAALARAVDAHDPWELTALHELVTLSGSLVLGLAVSHGWLDAPEAWRLSRIEEAWNIREWGEDEEAAAQACRREADFGHAARLLGLLRAA
ncbi:ATPase [Limibaculum sp. M0105]|uniref:ATPase n=1 Tax=Thermohalobaculum xanthum TaxID=2753746 RepID=A0A8J7M6C2_9RHOB|nr:ATP12 family protein [Thermohalobaculum xanthum]MBK0398995.1 ATPase [Thermohalobaculum xanthum]